MLSSLTAQKSAHRDWHISRGPYASNTKGRRWGRMTLTITRRARRHGVMQFGIKLMEEVTMKNSPLTSARVKLHVVGVRGVEVDVAGTRLVHQLAGVAARRPALPPVPRGRAAVRTEIMACNRRGREKRWIFMYACRYYNFYKQATEHCLRLLPGPSSVQASDF